MTKATQKEYYYGTGRRKTSIARVFLRPGVGKILINKRSLDEYFGRETAHMVIRQPLVITDTTDKFDITVTVVGGGSSGQAGAVRLGIARALIAYDEKSASVAEGDVSSTISFKRKLRAAGLVTRDPRVVERKKVGKHKARKGVQFSKR